MIKLLKDCNIRRDTGVPCGDGCCWNPYWESEARQEGEIIDDHDCMIDISSLEEGEDFAFLRDLNTEGY